MCNVYFTANTTFNKKIDTSIINNNYSLTVGVVFGVSF